VALTNTFNVAIDYLTNGVASTFWDGVYFGAGEFVNSGVGGGGLGATIQCDSHITTANTLTIESTGTAWEGADDDGFFLYKIAPGDFSMTVHVVSPYDNSSFNTAGLQARAFSAGGDPFTINGNGEDYVSWTRFDQFGFANYLRNEVNGGVQQINPGGAPNSNYWLRMDRVRSTNFMFYQKASAGAAWSLVTFPAPVSGTTLRRGDLNGQPLQVGIIHATFNNQIGVQFTDFSLILSNVSYAAPPSPPTGLSVSNGNAGIDVSWTTGAGSTGSLVVVWTGTNGALKQMPANGSNYTANASYGAGGRLLGAGYYVVYNGTGTSVTFSNIEVNTTYNVAVLSYAGSGTSISYNRTPARATLTVPPNEVSMQADVESPDVLITFVANPGKWYWLQSSDALSPATWVNVGSEPVLANSEGMVVVHLNGALATQRFYRLQQLDPLFGIKTSNGAVTSLKRTDDAFPTEYIAGGRRLGDANLKYRQTGTNWIQARTVNMTGIQSVTYSTNATGTEYKASYRITNSLSGALIFESIFTFHQDILEWSLNVSNLTAATVELGDLALPLPMNTTYSGTTSSAMKHHYIEGHGSFIFWMRPNSVGPFLLMTPVDDAWLEYWDVLNGGFEVYVHSLTAAGIAATQNTNVITAGDRWRQTNTSLTLGAGGSKLYTFKFQWADGYEAIRQALVDEGSIDVRVIPGMTLATNLPARIALRTAQTINSITAEFPSNTQITSLGSTNIGTNGTYLLYDVLFSRLGENKLTINYGAGKKTYLEFFITEPVETLIKKRASFLVNTIQINDPSKWYNSLYSDLNMNNGVHLSPDVHDTLTNTFQVYEIASDDAGEGRPAFMAEKLAVHPVQSEVTSLDNYITNFVWGGLQRKTNETFSYAIYGVPNWYVLRTNNQNSFGRGYDYPHIVVMYYGMYRTAKDHPNITTYLPAIEYLRRAHGTAIAMWTYGGGQADFIGLMNEVVYPGVIDALEVEGLTSEAASLRALWETKVHYYVAGSANLFGSEYAFDSTGFESQQAYARYAVQHTNTMGATNPAAFLQAALQFMNTQIAANVFDRGWLETCYYYYGSDYRSGMGNDYVVTYMSQMGGWGLLDYAFYFATNHTDYLRLGIASYLNGWSTMNTGTPESNYGFWYPGAVYDGGCGGGFEPAPLRNTWLGGQPMHRGAWYHAAEQEVGFCGAIRGAASALADDPIFGRVAYLGTWQNVTNTNHLIPQDGVRRRFHAMLNTSKLHVILDQDRFAANQPIICTDDQSYTAFQMESDVTSPHNATLHFTVSSNGLYTVSNNYGLITTTNLVAGKEAVITLPVDASATGQPFVITR
jgi:hypothetical protein